MNQWRRSVLIEVSWLPQISCRLQRHCVVMVWRVRVIRGYHHEPFSQTHINFAQWKSYLLVDIYIQTVLVRNYFIFNVWKAASRQNTTTRGKILWESGLARTNIYFIPIFIYLIFSVWITLMSHKVYVFLSVIFVLFAPLSVTSLHNPLF